MDDAGNAGIVLARCEGCGHLDSIPAGPHALPRAGWHVVWGRRLCPKCIAARTVCACGGKKTVRSDECRVCHNRRTPRNAWRAEAIERRRNGEPLAAIAALFGVTRERVRQCTTSVTEKRCACGRMMPAGRRHICDACAAANKIGWDKSRQTVPCECGGRKASKARMCRECRKGQRHAGQRYQTILRLYRTGLVCREIAPHVGMCTHGVYMALRAMGEPMRPKGKRSSGAAIV